MGEDICFGDMFENIISNFEAYEMWTDWGDCVIPSDYYAAVIEISPDVANHKESMYHVIAHEISHKYLYEKNIMLNRNCFRSLLDK